MMHVLRHLPEGDFYRQVPRLVGNLSDALKIPGGIRVGVQGVNLLNEVTKTSQAYTGDPDVLAARSYFMNDRRFSFIIRGNF